MLEHKDLIQIEIKGNKIVVSGQDNNVCKYVAVKFDNSCCGSIIKS